MTGYSLNGGILAMNDRLCALFTDFPEDILPVFAGDGDEFAVDVDAIPVDAVDFVEGDGIAAMDAGKSGGGEFVGYLGEGLVGDVGVVGGADPDIVFEAF